MLRTPRLWGAGGGRPLIPPQGKSAPRRSSCGGTNGSRQQRKGIDYPALPCQTASATAMPPFFRAEPCGGGRPDFAEAGGKDASRIDALLDKARELVTSALS